MSFITAIFAFVLFLSGLSGNLLSKQCVFPRSLLCNYHALWKYIPYSAKFSRHLYFVDWPLKVFSLHNVRGMTAFRKPRL